MPYDTYDMIQGRTYVTHIAVAWAPRFGWYPDGGVNGSVRYLTSKWSLVSVLSGSEPSGINWSAVTIDNETGLRSDTGARTLTHADPNGFPGLTSSGAYAWAFGAGAWQSSTVWQADYSVGLAAPPFTWIGDLRVQWTVSNLHSDGTLDATLDSIMALVDWGNVFAFDAAHNMTSKWFIYNGTLEFEEVESDAFSGCKCTGGSVSKFTHYHWEDDISGLFAADGYSGSALGTKAAARLYGPATLYRRTYNGQLITPDACDTVSDQACSDGYFALPTPPILSPYVFRAYNFSDTPCS